MPRIAIVLGVVVAASIVAFLFFRGGQPAGSEGFQDFTVQVPDEPTRDSEALLAPSVEDAPRQAVGGEAPPQRTVPEGSVLLAGRVLNVPIGGGVEDRIGAANVRVRLQVFALGDDTPHRKRRPMRRGGSSS